MRHVPPSRSFPVILLGVLALVGVFSVLGHRAAVDLQLPYPAHPSLFSDEARLARPETIYVGVISRFPSNIIYQGYQPVMDYLTESTPYHFVLRPSESYDQTLQKLVDREVGAAFLGSFLYVRARAEHGIRPLLQPLNEAGEGSFQSALITRDDAPFQSAADLVGGRLALPSELSFSANWLRLDPEIQKILPLEKLEVVQYFPHHQTVVFEVLQGNFDAGVVKDRVAHEFRHRGLRILAISQPVPGSPLVVPALENPALEAAILDALLALDPTDPATATRLSTWDPEFAFGFTRARDEDYNRIRALLTRGDR